MRKILSIYVATTVVYSLAGMEVALKAESLGYALASIALAISGCVVFEFVTPQKSPPPEGP